MIHLPDSVYHAFVMSELRAFMRKHQNRDLLETVLPPDITPEELQSDVNFASVPPPQREELSKPAKGLLP